MLRRMTFTPAGIASLFMLGLNTRSEQDSCKLLTALLADAYVLGQEHEKQSQVEANNVKREHQCSSKELEEGRHMDNVSLDSETCG